MRSHSSLLHLTTPKPSFPRHNQTVTTNKATFYKLLLNKESEKQQESAQILRHHLLFIEKEGIGKLSDDGSYWFGEFLSLVDLAFYPWFERFAVVEHYRAFALPSECVRLQQWWEAMGKRPSVRAIANQSKFYIEQYLQYANHTATGITAQEMRQN
ncbi:MAG TPA: glutathione S-transferase domain-containing protein [Leptolyngbyaceae cyanobacterium]